MPGTEIQSNTAVSSCGTNGWVLPAAATAAQCWVGGATTSPNKLVLPTWKSPALVKCAHVVVHGGDDQCRRQRRWHGLMRVAARAYDPGLPAAREHEQQRAPCGDARECPASRGVAAGAARPLPLRTIPVVAETKGALALPLVSAILVGLPSHPLHLGGMPLCNAPGCSALEPWLRRFQRPGLGEAGPRLRAMCRVHAWRSTRETASATRAGGEKLPAVAGHGFRLSHKVTHGVLGGGGVCRRGAAVQGLYRGGVSSVRGGGGQGGPHFQQRRLRDAGAVVFGLDDA